MIKLNKTTKLSLASGTILTLGTACIAYMNDAYAENVDNLEQMGQIDGIIDYQADRIQATISKTPGDQILNGYSKCIDQHQQCENKSMDKMRFDSQTHYHLDDIINSYCRDYAAITGIKPTKGLRQTCDRIRESHLALSEGPSLKEQLKCQRNTSNCFQLVLNQ